MKIAILVGGLPTLYNGGTEVATARIAEYATRAGHDVHVIAADGSDRGAKSYQSNIFTVHRVPTIPGSYIHGITFIPQATTTLLKLKPDLVHAQAMYMAPSALITHHKFPFILFERGGVHMNKILDRPLYYLFLKHARRVIAQTNNQKEQLLKYCKRDIEIIPNGVDIDKFTKKDKTESRMKLRLPLDRKIALSVGRCRPEKNVRDFVLAAKLLHDFLFVVVGDGPQMNSLRALCVSEEIFNITFAGSVENSIIPTYMSAADVLVNTSLSEGFPVTTLEGMACGLPLVAPMICGIPEIIEDGVNGLLSRPQDYQSTASKIKLILDYPRVAQNMADENIAKVKQYTWENVVRRLYG